MFDNLRESADSSFYEEEPNDLYKEPAPSRQSVSMPRRRRSNGNFLGMMLMLTVCIMGTSAMFLFQKMSF
jgi:hypothetical protein